ncbi:hypothetical protein Tco_0901935, partial [Tanacetum coccineum]
MGIQEESDPIMASVQGQNMEQATTTTTLAIQNATTEVPPFSSSHSISSNYTSAFLNLENLHSTELEVVSMMVINVQHESPHTSPLLTVPISVIPEHTIFNPSETVTTASATTISSLLSLLFHFLQQSTPIPTLTKTKAKTSTTVVPDFETLNALHQRMANLEKDVKELKDVDNSTKVISKIKSEVLNAVKEYLGSSLDDALHKVIQRNFANIIKEHTVPDEIIERLRQQYAPQKSIEDIREIKMEHARKQQVPKETITSSDTTTLEEFDQKTTLFETMTFNKILKHRALNHALIESILKDKDAMEEGTETSKKTSVTKESSKGKSLTTSSKSTKSGKSAKDQVIELISVQDYDYAKYDDAKFDNTDMPMDQGEDLRKTDEQPNDKAVPDNDYWLDDLAKDTKPPLTFDELMHTPIDFSAFAMNNLKIDNLTKEIVVGPAYNLLKGTCKSYMELDYTMEEGYRALSEQINWNNPEGHRCPYDLTKPLPMQMSSQGRQIVPADFFFNNDLEYLRGGSNDKKYTASTIKSKAARYKLKGIEDMVPNLWIPVEFVEGWKSLSPLQLAVEEVISEDEIPPPPPSQTLTQQPPHTVSTIKLPILKKGEYDIWAMKMEHYFAHTDYPIWEVIQRGNGPEAIKSRFGGNNESKKMQKYILKQQFKGFSAFPLKMQIRSSLGLYLLPGLNSFESDVKGSTASSSSTQNVAFILENTSSTNDVSTAYGVSNSSGHNSQYEHTLSYSLLSNKSSCLQLDHEDLEQLDEKLQFDAMEPVGFDKTKVECYSCHKTGHFARESRSKGNQDSRRRDAWNTGNKDKDNGRRSGKQEDSKALVTLYGEGVDWTSYSEDEQENYAFMACNSSGSDTDVTSCSKEYDKTDVLTYHKKLLAEAEKEKEDLKAKVEKWHNSSKNFNILLNSQMSARDKAGLGISETENSHVYDRYPEGMHVVPLPIIGIYIPSGPNKEIDDSQFTYGSNQSKPSESDARSSDFNSCESNCSEETHESMPVPIINEPKVVSEPKFWFDAPIIDEYESDSEDEHVVPINAARKLNTVKPIVNNARPKAGFHESVSPFRKSFNRTTALRTNFSKQKVNTTKVNTVSAVKGKRETAIKSSAGCNWRPKRHYWNQVSKYNSGSSLRNCATFKDPLGRLKPKKAWNKGIVDNGCSRHTTGNKAYLAEYQDFNGGPVTFGGSKGYITGKGKIKIGKLDFEDVCFVKELHHFNLFSVSQMCDKKNKVLFTDSETKTQVCLLCEVILKQIPAFNFFCASFESITAIEITWKWVKEGDDT